MKNYVVWSDYTIEDNPAKSAAYKEMTKLSIETAKQNLQGDYEIIVWSGLVGNHQEVFQRNWINTRELWHTEPCNILFVDSDTVFLNPVDIFERFRSFTLFNYTDPKSDLRGKPYFNCGVRYFPSTMNPALWPDLNTLLGNWPENQWDYEQQAYNTMLWHSLNDTNFDQCYHPEIAYQAFAGLNEPMDAWNNGVNWLTAGIIHYHGSRSNDRISLAQTALTIRSTVQ